MVRGSPIGVYRLYKAKVYHFERVVGSYDFTDTHGNHVWWNLSERGLMKFGSATLYVYMNGSHDFPAVYTLLE